MLVCGLREIPKRLQLNSQFNLHLVSSVIEMRNAFLLPDVIGVMIYIDKLNFKTWQNLKKLVEKYPLKKFIFCGKNLEKTLKNELDRHRNCFFFWPHEEEQLTSKLKQILGTASHATRRSERKKVTAPLLVKASEIMVDSPIGQKLRVVIEGHFIDFSKHGAKLFLCESWLVAKDYICIMYQKMDGEWVSMESQIRWTENDPTTGRVLMGVQFIARAA